MVSKKAEGERLDKFLARELGSLSRTKIISLINKGQVYVDGKLKKPSFCLDQSQEIRVLIKEEKKVLRPYQFKVKIIYEDNDIIVVVKPGGLTTHPPQESYHKTLINALLYLKKDLARINPLRPGVVHRLDKETSGVMVLAKNSFSHRALSAQFKERRVRKEYYACVWGEVKKERFKIELPLSRDKKNRLKMKVSLLGSKAALTEVKVVKRLQGATLLLLKPLTGRMHQLRVHLKFLGFPIAGDKKYGVKDKCKGLLLHAHKLGFHHPRTEKYVEFTSPLPKRFNDFICE